MGLYVLFEQFFPPAPAFKEDRVPPGSQVGKVFLITGANAGIGFELLKMLYLTGATIYMAGRSPERMSKAIEQLKADIAATATPATIKTVYVDFADLETVKPAAAAVLTQENRLDMIWNNAGATYQPGSVSKQGIEASAAANCVAPLLFTQELLPLLQAAAKKSPKGSVRIIWTGSVMFDLEAPPNGVDFERIEKPTQDEFVDYGASKVGNLFLTHEGARRWGKDGIISICQNPGNIYTDIWRDKGWVMMALLRTFVLYPAKYGAYTMLYAGFFLDVNESTNGAYIWPWGKIKPPARADILKGLADGRDTQFWNWCENKWKLHV